MAAPAREASDPLESWSEGRIRSWQAERINEVVQYAHERSAFYRRIWADHDVGSPEVRSLEDLRRLPIVKKQDLLTAGEVWLRSGEGPVGFSTRGTSGEPLILWLSPAEKDAYVIPTARGFRWAGLRPDTTALLLSPGWHRLAAMEGHAAAGLGARPTYFWGSLGGSEHVDSFLDAMEETRPQFVTSTPPFILAALRRCEETGRDPRDPFRHTEAMLLVGLPLTPGLRDFLQARLEVPRISERGGTQEGAALDECEAQLEPHVHADVCYLEVLDERGEAVAPGSRGRLVLTKLVPGGSPFVRYDTEDVAAFFPGDCRCGRVLPRLRIFGRPESSVVVDGRTITAYDVRRCLDEDADLVGRVTLLVRGSGHPGILRIAVEGRPFAEAALKETLCERLGVPQAEVTWLGDARVTWGFRQVIEVSQLHGG